MKASRFRRIAHSMLFLAVAGCGGGDPDPMIPPDPPRPTTIAISPESAELTYISQVTPFSATVHDQYGAAMAVTVTWSSSDDAVFTVDGTGRVTATGNGSGSLQASVDAINATASITVSQRAATVMIVSGDNQEGRRDEVLPEPIVARVEDRGGFGVAGLTLTFRPATNNGSVSAATVEADENGEAMTEWTLGDQVREPIPDCFRSGRYTEQCFGAGDPGESPAGPQRGERECFATGSDPARDGRGRGRDLERGRR